MIVAIDPSLTGLAIVCGNDVGQFQSTVFTSESRGKIVSNRIARFDELIGRLIDWIEPPHSEFRAIYIEGYANYNHPATTIALCEFGGLLRYHLLDVCPKIYEVAASTLKKFTTGKGGADKAFMAASLTKRYGVMFDNDNQFDAYGLYRFGLVAEELSTPTTAFQQEAVEKFLGRKLHSSFTE